MFDYVLKSSTALYIEIVADIPDLIWRSRMKDGWGWNR